MSENVESNEQGELRDETPRVERGGDNPFLAKNIVQLELIRRFYERTRSVPMTTYEQKQEASFLWTGGEDSPAKKFDAYVTALYERGESLPTEGLTDAVLDTVLASCNIQVSHH